MTSKDVTQPIACGQMSAREWASKAPYGDVHSTLGGHLSCGIRAMKGCCVADRGNATCQSDNLATRLGLEFRMDTSFLRWVNNHLLVMCCDMVKVGWWHMIGHVFKVLVYIRSGV